MTYLSSYKHFETGSINVARAGIESQTYVERQRQKQSERKRGKFTQMFRQYFDRLLTMIRTFL